MSGTLYVVTALVAIALEALGVMDLQRAVGWPVVVGALFWFFGVPWLLWRANACGGCGQRMAVTLLPGTASGAARPRVATDGAKPRR